VVQNLLSFARQRKPQKEQVDLAKVIEETLALRDYDLKVNNIKLERQIEPKLPAVTADPHQLEQVFLNIINNAVDAMLESGQAGVLKVYLYADANHVHAEFHDSGPGITEPSRIFEPFYTTKGVGKGTGLGLSICYGIIQEHGGNIVARNRPEGGAIIEVRLPAAKEIALEKVVTMPRREMAISGRILLIENEEAVLEFERDVLAGAGAEVITATTVEQMKATVQSQVCDAVIMDGRMSGDLGPPELCRWLAENRPGLEKHLLFTFSSIAEADVRRFLQENNVPYLRRRPGPARGSRRAEPRIPEAPLRFCGTTSNGQLFALPPGLPFGERTCDGRRSTAKGVSAVQCRQRRGPHPCRSSIRRVL